VGSDLLKASAATSVLNFWQDMAGAKRLEVVSFLGQCFGEAVLRAVEQLELVTEGQACRRGVCRHRKPHLEGVVQLNFQWLC